MGRLTCGKDGMLYIMSHVPTASSSTGFKVVCEVNSVESCLLNPACPFAPIMQTVGLVVIPGNMFAISTSACASAADPCSVAIKCAGKNFDIDASRAVDISLKCGRSISIYTYFSANIGNGNGAILACPDDAPSMETTGYVDHRS